MFSAGQGPWGQKIPAPMFFVELQIGCSLLDLFLLLICFYIIGSDALYEKGLKCYINRFFTLYILLTWRLSSCLLYLSYQKGVTTQFDASNDYCYLLNSSFSTFIYCCSL